MSTVILIAGLVLAVVVLVVDAVRQRLHTRRLASDLAAQQAVEEHRVQQIALEADRLRTEVHLAREKSEVLAVQLDRVAREATAASLVALSALAKQQTEHRRALAAGTPLHSVLMLETTAGTGR